MFYSNTVFDRTPTNKEIALEKAYQILEKAYSEMWKQAEIYNLSDEERKDFLTANKETDLIIKAFQSLAKSYNAEKFKQTKND